MKVTVQTNGQFPNHRLNKTHQNLKDKQVLELYNCRFIYVIIQRINMKQIFDTQSRLVIHLSDVFFSLDNLVIPRGIGIK